MSTALQALKKLQDEGYRISLVGGNIHFKKLEGINPDPSKIHKLLTEIKENKAEAVEYLKKRFSYDRLWNNQRELS